MVLEGMKAYLCHHRAVGVVLQAWRRPSSNCPPRNGLHRVLQCVLTSRALLHHHDNLVRPQQEVGQNWWFEMPGVSFLQKLLGAAADISPHLVLQSSPRTPHASASSLRQNWSIPLEPQTWCHRVLQPCPSVQGKAASHTRMSWPGHPQVVECRPSQAVGCKIGCLPADPLVAVEYTNCLQHALTPPEVAVSRNCWHPSSPPSL
mmetsp:Transcript_113938/g.226706  ORF Transcript_113938/g.226706 Transcript_113938/m.226706 type:complete len:204 (+) Transcript_113938:1142-1753(+)